MGLKCVEECFTQRQFVYRRVKVFIHVFISDDAKGKSKQMFVYDVAVVIDGAGTNNSMTFEHSHEQYSLYLVF